MKALIALTVITILVALYVVWGRKWLKARTWPWSKRFFELTEPIEIALWGKSETILWSRFLQLMGAVAAFLAWFGALDMSPYIALVPEKYQPWLLAAPFAAITLSGVISELLRRSTSRPLEIVAVSDNAAPAVLAEVQKAQAAKEEAVATIVAEKNEPSAVTEKKE
jgi:hypothetical protein